MYKQYLATPNDEENISYILLHTGLAKNEKEAKELASKELARGDSYLIAEKDDKLAGLVSWLYHGAYRHGLTELCHIGVLPEFRGVRAEIGKNTTAYELFFGLVKHSKEYFEQHNSRLHRVFLWTHANNEISRKFYERKCGMKLGAIIKDHFRKEVDECYYSLDFD